MDIRVGYCTEIQLEKILAELVEDIRNKPGWIRAIVHEAYWRISLVNDKFFYEEEWNTIPHDSPVMNEHLHRLTGPARRYTSVNDEVFTWAVHGVVVPPFDGLLRGEGFENYVKNEECAFVIKELHQAGVISVDPVLLENLLMI